MFDYFVGLIYVTKTEHDAVMRMYDWKEHKFDNDEQIYYLATFEKDGKTFSVCAAQQDEMGMTAAATLSMKVIEHFRPQYLLMPGIAAGTGKEST